MYNGLGLLRNRLTRYTDVLQEYFLPHDRLVPFLREAREVLRAHDSSCSARRSGPCTRRTSCSTTHAAIGCPWCSTSARR